jgi:alkylation response protein AidB-like acyl-CoA dehydrogenase
MEILAYTDQHHRFRKRLKAFLLREVVPNIDQWEADRAVPKDIWRKMGTEGFLCTWVSPAYGGQGCDFLHSVIVCEELFKINQSGLTAYVHSDIIVPYIDAYGSEELKARYLPPCITGDMITAIAMTEPNAGSDLSGIVTTAIEDGDEVVINGTKTFISNGIFSDLVIVAARDPAVANSYEAISLYLVESGTPGFTRGRQLDKMGAHSQDTAELFFSECRIPRANRLGEKGQGFLMLMAKLQQERLLVALGAITIAEYLLSEITTFCRTTLVGDRPLSRSQAVQFALVEMATDVKIGRTFIDKLIADHMENRPIIIETSMAKYWSTEMIKRTADRCLDLLGPEGMREARALVRAWRDVRVMSIFAGTNEIMKGIAAKYMNL